LLLLPKTGKVLPTRERLKS